jgi:hypothetical protein
MAQAVREPAWQACGPEFKPTVTKPKRKKRKKFLKRRGN